MNLTTTQEYDSDKNFIPMTEKYFEYFGTKNPKGLEGIYKLHNISSPPGLQAKRIVALNAISLFLYIFLVVKYRR